MSEWINQDLVRLIIHKVFDTWGTMAFHDSNKQNCFKHIKEITSAFNGSETIDGVLSKLVQIEGIGVTLATGILWAFDPNKYVPVDKKTTGFCAERCLLKWGNNLRLGYERACRHIVNEVIGEGKRWITIRAMVLRAEKTDPDLWIEPEWRTK